MGVVFCVAVVLICVVGVVGCCVFCVLRVVGGVECCVVGACVVVVFMLAGVAVVSPIILLWVVAVARCAASFGALGVGCVLFFLLAIPLP